MSSDDTLEFPRVGNDPPSATRSVLRILDTLKTAFPDELSSLRVPDPARPCSRQTVADLLWRVELARLASFGRGAIARAVTDEVQRTFVLRMAGERVPLEHAFAASVAPLPVEEFKIERRVEPDLAGRPDTGQSHALAPPKDQETPLNAPDELSIEAMRALDWVDAQLGGRPSTEWDLRGQKFVLMGGTAELGPLSRLLAAGADVLTTHQSAESLAWAAWLDQPPGSAWRGRLFAGVNAINLLGSPVEFVESARAFATGVRVHVGALAYRGGQGREWRLAAAMDGAVRALHRAGVVASVTWYLSPSVPAELSPETGRLAIERWSAMDVGWRKAVRAVTGDVVFQPNAVSAGDRVVSRSFVPRQGASYMAANLWDKNYVAETWLDDAASESAGLRVSSNVAPLTATRSTRSNATEVLFPKLAAFGVRVFEPARTREIMFRLMLHDLFAPGRERGVVPFDQQVHGGIFTNALALDSVLKLSYVRGLTA